MTRQRLLAVGMGIALSATMIPNRTLAANHAEDEKPIRLYATAMAGPIGMTHSLGGLSINGRATHGEQVIWGGELLRASKENIIIELSALGQVTLKSGAIVKLSRAKGALEDNKSGDVLVAAIVTGEIDVRLAEAGAYVEAWGSAFTASRGASFRVGARDGKAMVNTTRGTVSEEQAAQPQYRIRPPVGQGSEVSVKARATRQIQMQVTDENGRPLPDVPVVFAIGGGGGGGSLGTGTAAASTITVTTNAQGIATASFTAGPASGSASVTATVAGTSVSTTVGVTTTAAGILAGTTGIIAGVAAAAGAAATVVAVKKTQDNNPAEPVTAGAPNITPR